VIRTIVILLLLTVFSYGNVIIERWGFAGKKNQHATMTYNSTSKVLSVDLAPLTSSTTVHRAVLYTAMDVFNGWDGAAFNGRNTEALTGVSIHAKTGSGASDYNASALELIPPYYRSFDVTDVVKGWVANTSSNHGIYIKDFFKFKADTTYLEIMYEGNVTSPPTQVGGLHAFHRAGQTFITWNELQDWVGKDNPNTVEMAAVLVPSRNTPNETRYYVYQHTSPITASNLKDAKFLESIQPISIWNLMDITIDWQCEQCPNGLWDFYMVERFSTDEDGQGTVLPRNKALYVHTATGDQTSYYAVLTVINGKANTSSLTSGNSLTSGIVEKVQTTEPTYQGPDSVQYGGWVDHFIHFLSPPFSNLPGPGISWENEFNDGRHYVNLRVKVNNTGGAVTLECDSWGGTRSHSVTGYGQPINGGIKIRTMDQWPANGFTGLHECLGTFKAWNQGSVHNYAARRIMSYVSWADTRWGIDSNQIYMNDYEGMWSVRYNDVFAALYLRGLTDPGQINPSIPHQRGVNLDRVWGQEAWGIAIAGSTMNAWDWFDYSKAYYTDTIHMAPMRTQPGPSHDHKGRGDRAWGGEPRMVWNTQKYRQGFAMSWRGKDYQSYSPGYKNNPTCCTQYNGLTKTDPFVAFSNNSLDHDIGDTMWHNDTIGYGGDWGGQVNGFSYFNNISETQTSFSVDLFLDAPYMSDFQCLPTERRNCGISLDTGAHVDVTPRRMQSFEVNKCDTFKYVVLNGASPEDSGICVAQAKNCVTAPSIFIEKDVTRKLIFTFQSRYDGTSPCESTVSRHGKVRSRADYINMHAQPLPFNSYTKIFYSIPSHSSGAWGNGASRNVCIRIYDIKGNVVRTLVNRIHNRGMYSAMWNGSDQSGKTVSAGIYLVRINGGTMQRSIKMVLSK
jgi:hypothetical protein